MPTAWYAPAVASANGCWSMSWMWSWNPRAVSPDRHSTGERARRASVSAVAVLVSPGPWVTVQTPGRPVERA